MGIRKIVVREKEIIVVDFAGLGADAMMSQFTELRELVLTEKNKQLIVTVYAPGNFGTPRYMNHVRAEAKLMIDRIDKIATVGLSATQKLLLKGLSFFFRRNFKTFDTLDDAVRYLVDDETTDFDIPEYLKEL